MRLDQFGSLLRVWSKRIKPFLALTFAMGVGIAGLFLFEAAVLRWMEVPRLAPSPYRQIHAADLSLSADGRWAASWNLVQRRDVGASLEWEILLHDLRNPRTPVRAHLRERNPQGSAVSPDGRHLIFTTRDGGVFMKRFSTDSQHARLLDRLSGELPGRPALSPDGNYLLVAGRTHYYLWWMPTGERLHRFAHDRITTTAHCFSADSRRLLAGDEDGRLRVWDLCSGERKSVELCPGESIEALDVSPDGRLVAFVTIFGRLGVHIVERDQTVWQTAADSQRRLCVAFSPDGSLMATAGNVPDGLDHRIFIHSAETGALRYTFRGHTAYVIGLRFTADGTLCSWGQDGLICGWDGRSGRELWRICCADAFTAADEPGMRHDRVGLAGREVRLHDSAASRAKSPSNRCRVSTPGGFTRCASKPASNDLRRSSSVP